MKNNHDILHVLDRYRKPKRKQASIICKNKNNQTRSRETAPQLCSGHWYCMLPHYTTAILEKCARVKGILCNSPSWTDKKLEENCFYFLASNKHKHASCKTKHALSRMSEKCQRRCHNTPRQDNRVRFHTKQWSIFVGQRLRGMAFAPVQSDDNGIHLKLLFGTVCQSTHLIIRTVALAFSTQRWSNWRTL